MKRWPLRPVGDLLERVVKPVKIEPDREYREIGIRSHCRGIFHKPPVTGEQLGSKRVYWIEPGCFTVNIVFAWEHAVAMTTKAEQGMIASHRFPMYQSKNGHLLTEFAYLYFASPRGKYDLGIASPGGAGRNKTLGQEEFKRLEVPVPPLEIQRQVVGIAETWSRAIGQLGTLIEAKERLRTGLIQQLLRARAEDRRGHSKWSSAKLGDIGTFSKGAGVSRAEALPQGLPAVRYGELYTDHHVVIQEFHTLISRASAKKSRRIHRGDILIAGSGETAEEIGKAAAFVEDSEAYAGGDIVIFSPREADSVYLSYVLNSGLVRRFILARAQGQSVVHLYRRDLELLKITLPPLPVQKKISRALTTADKEIALLKKRRDTLTKQRHGLLQELLRGEASHP